MLVFGSFCVCTKCIMPRKKYSRKQSEKKLRKLLFLTAKHIFELLVPANDMGMLTFAISSKNQDSTHMFASRRFK